MADGPLLAIEDLEVDFATEDGVVQAVRRVDLDVERGEIVAIVGESGSGKSVTALSILGLHPPNRTTVRGRLEWKGADLLAMSRKEMEAVRGGEIAMVFQDPLTALNPVQRVGRQISETVQAHRSVTRREARARAIEMLDRVGIPQPSSRVDDYPHEFSGGMRQRAMIAMALSCDPQLIIADEPTTALDVTVQAQVLDLLVDSARTLDAAVLLITHDLGIVAGVADRVLVMYAGRMVETGTVDEVFEEPSHPYTVGLLRSLPRVDADGTDELVPIGGQPPSMLTPPPGCAFHPRCPHADAESGCMSVMPELVAIGDGGHRLACHRYGEIDLSMDMS